MRSPKLGFAVVLLAALVSCGGSNNKSITETTGAGHTTETTNEVNAGEATTTAKPPAETAKLAVESGFSSEIDSIGTRHSSAGAVLTNPRSTQAACGVQVTFNLKGAGGAVLDTQTENVAWVPAKGRVLVAPLQIGFDQKVAPTGLGVTTIVNNYETAKTYSGCGESFSISKGVTLDVVSATIVRSEFSSEVNGQVKNPTNMVVQYSDLTCIYRAAGTIVGGSTTTITDPIPPGGTIAFRAGDVPSSAQSVECQVTA